MAKPTKTIDKLAMGMYIVGIGNRKRGEKMSELTPNENTKRIVDDILKECEKRELKISEVCDIPAELQRRINRNIAQLKTQTFSNLP